MAKSNRRRKLERAKRQARASQKRAAAEARQAADETIRSVLERYDRMLDPDTPAADLAGLLAEQYHGEPVSSVLVDRMTANGSSHQRLAEAAQAMLAVGASDGGPPSLTALTFAAAAARAAGDAGTARGLLDQALAAAEDPDTRLALAQHLSAGGRLADAVELLEARLREAPDDDHAAELYGALLEEAFSKAHAEPPTGGCPCGLGAAWQDCCEPRVRAALSRFADRSGMTALSDAVSAYLTSSGYGQAVEDGVSEWLSAADDLGWKPAERAALGALAAEVALLSASLAGDGEADDTNDPSGSADEDDTDTPLAAFAADPAVPGELAARAAIWREHIHYGLWRVDDPCPAPGLWCTDIVSGVTRYVGFPAELTREMPRWAVWLGGLVPVDGIWRSTGLGFRLSPTEADAAAELAQDATTALVHAIAGKRPKRRSPRATGPLRIGRADPLGVYADFEDPVPAAVASLMGKLTGVLLPRIITDVHEHRSAPPALRNTDGDEMCLITAQIRVSDGAEAAGQLAARPDFERDVDDPARIVWYGLPVSDAQREALLAEAAAELRSQGYTGASIEDSATPQRWVRGTLQVSAGQIVADINSARRLARLLEILARIGAAPVVIDERRIDPAQDFVWPGGEHASPGGAAPSAEGWEKHWLDEHVPALRGNTPRQAARGKERPLLEALLRQFEYEADLLAVAGKSGVDTRWLREELGMEELGMTDDLDG
jgi:tetratricopeptide (TPR) repeat protein